MYHRPGEDDTLVLNAGGAPTGSRRRPLGGAVVASLLAFAALLTAAGTGIYRLGLAVYETGCAAGTGVEPVCTYTADHAAAGPDATVFVATWAENRTGCCKVCMSTDGCGSVTFLESAHPGSRWLVNCVLYDDTVDVSAPVAHTGAWVCVPPDAGWTISWLQMWMDDAGQPISDQSMIGGAALIVRLGYYLVVLLLAWLQRLCGFSGAPVGESVMAPRVAASTARRAKTLLIEPPPEGIGWAALAGEAELWDVATEANRQEQPSWAAAVSALELTEAQARWVAGARLLLWHWMQPLGFLIWCAAVGCC
jgi:hypothetical protein